jgi:hypothetical protein
LTLAARQFVATATAASVLLCSIVCACGSPLPDAHAVAAAQPAARPAGQHPHEARCHGHPVNDADSDGSHGGRPEPCHDGGHSCPHCQSRVTAASEDGRITAGLDPLGHPLATILPAVFTTPADVHCPTRRTTLGDPSPPPAPTLLRLHCALNT